MAHVLRLAVPLGPGTETVARGCVLVRRGLVSPPQVLCASRPSTPRGRISKIIAINYKHATRERTHMHTRRSPPSSVSSSLRLSGGSPQFDPEIEFGVIGLGRVPAEECDIDGVPRRMGLHERPERLVRVSDRAGRDMGDEIP